MASRVPASPSLKTYLTIIAVGLLSAAGMLTFLASLTGYSSLRLLLAAAVLLTAALSAGAAIFLHKNPRKAGALQAYLAAPQRARPLRLAAGGTFFLLWCLIWLPPQYTGGAEAYFLGLYPLILSGCLVSGLTLLFLLAPASRPSREPYWRAHPSTLSTMLVCLAAFLGIAILTRVGTILQNREPFWRGAGVPLLSWQVLAALVIAALALALQFRFPRRLRRLDMVIFLMIWLVAAGLWARQPIAASYWVTAPRPPNFEYYPFSDLETFDLGSQFALIGQGINNGVFWDRALYMSFLVYLHVLGGQDYQQLMALQAALFAVFPALLYLLGLKLHSRNAGILLAALTVMRGLNSLAAAPFIHLATFKHMLTDFPAAIGLAIFMLLLLKWRMSDRMQGGTVLWAAGALGLTSLLRPHVLLVVAAILIPCVLLGMRKSRPILWTGLALAAFLAGIAPWLLFGSGPRSVIDFYGLRVRAVISQRYPSLLPGPTAAAATPEATALASPTEPPGPTPAPTPLPRGAVELPPPGSSALPFPVVHYVHNLVTSVLIFPTSPQFLSLDDTLRAGESFWGLRWNGSMTTVAAAMLILNLLILALGMGAAWERLRWWGFLPLAVFLTYHAANALARTSGGRYLVPVDWILVAYFAVGLAELLRLGLSLVRVDVVGRPYDAAGGAASTRSQGWVQVAAVLACIFLAGCLVPLAGVLHPLRYPPTTTSDRIQGFAGLVEGTDLTERDMERFLSQPEAVLLYGRVLYPRYFPRGVGLEFSPLLFVERPYPRTIFDLIGPHGMVYVMLPGRVPQLLPNTADAYALGCLAVDTEGLPVLAAEAVVLPESAVVLRRDPRAPLSCPLPEPACDDNGSCR